jgi:Domain of unknown function (DUF3291)
MSSRTHHHLAQANVARMRAPLEDPIMAGFVAQLDRINALADRSRGFVWRLQTDDGNATGIRAFDDERILFNMSVWKSIEALHDYVYRSEHVAVFRDRRQWFEPHPAPTLVLWWIEAGNIPSIKEAKERLALLGLQGPTAEAFTFKAWFQAPGTAAPRERPDFETCEWMT